MLTVLAPAKINLTLEVLGRRPDGYHEIRSVIQTISLCDSLDFLPGENIEIKGDSPEWRAEKSLVSRAVSLLIKAANCKKGATISVSKRIPLLSGLGGDSSDAAATLRGLNKLWELGLSRNRLAELAQQLGSDVAFFLYGGTALVEGRGEKVTPLLPLSHKWVVLALPTVPRLPDKTRLLYESLNPNHYTSGQITEKRIKEISEGREFNPSLLFNTFENVAYDRFPWLRVSQQQMVKMGAKDVHLAGSGPTLFTMVKEKTEAEDLYQRFKQQKLEPYLAETLDTTDWLE